MLETINTAAVQVVLGAQGFDSQPNSSLPGSDVIQKIVGGLQTWGIYAAIAALIVGAVMIGWGSSSHNPQGAAKGKMFLLGGVVGLILIGGINAIGETFYDLGGEIKKGS